MYQMTHVRETLGPSADAAAAAASPATDGTSHIIWGENVPVNGRGGMQHGESRFHYFNILIQKTMKETLSILQLEATETRANVSLGQIPHAGTRILLIAPG